MKIVADAEELGELEGLSDAELVKIVRGGFKEFRGGSEAPTGEGTRRSAVPDSLRKGRDALGGNVGSSKEIEPTDHTADDPPPTPGTPRPPERDGGRLAASANDVAMEEHRIRNSGCADPEGALSLARARRINPESVHSMSEHIPGYGRLK